MKNLLLTLLFPFLAPLLAGQNVATTITWINHPNTGTAYDVSAASTTTFSKPKNMAGKIELFAIAKTEATAGGTLTITLQESYDDGATWVDHGSFSAITAAVVAGLAVAEPVRHVDRVTSDRGLGVQHELRGAGGPGGGEHDARVARPGR